MSISQQASLPCGDTARGRDTARQWSLVTSYCRATGSGAFRRSSPKYAPVVVAPGVPQHWRKEDRDGRNMGGKNQFISVWSNTFSFFFFFFCLHFHFELEELRFVAGVFFFWLREELWHEIMTVTESILTSNSQFYMYTSCCDRILTWWRCDLTFNISHNQSTNHNSFATLLKILVNVGRTSTNIPASVKAVCQIYVYSPIKLSGFWRKFNVDAPANVIYLFTVIVGAFVSSLFQAQKKSIVSIKHVEKVISAMYANSFA